MRFQIVGQENNETVTKIEMQYNNGDGDVEIWVNGNMVAYFDSDEEEFVVWTDALEEEGLGFREE